VLYRSIGAERPDMDLFKPVRLIFTLFWATYLFCWIFTSHWNFGPIFTVVCFLGGVLLISLIGVLMMQSADAVSLGAVVGNIGNCLWLVWCPLLDCLGMDDSRL
jgi:apolipoprotein N-acyltransferase